MTAISEHGIPLRVPKQELSRIYVDHAVGLQFFVEQATTVRIETPFKILDGPRELQVIVAQSSTLVHVLNLLHEQLLDANAQSDGTLRLVFANGVVIVVPPDPNYEAWTLEGPAGYLVVCRPGGELAVWQDVDRQGAS